MEQEKSNSTTTGGPRFVCVAEVKRRVTFSSNVSSAFLTERLYTLPRFVRLVEQKQEARQGVLCSGS